LKPEINIWIEQAENTWLADLYSHAASLFHNNFLPSHDHSHHLRVWNLCKSLLKEVNAFCSALDPSLVEGVLIAALFHDLGMVSSTREDHGRLSREACEHWFRESGQNLPERYEEILIAIEEHDRKDEQIYGSFQPGNSPTILAFLSVADDLEALGTIGIYRYAEIYLVRGIPMEELGIRILENAGNRFKKIEEGCHLCPGLLEEYRKQYDELCNFYEKYNLQVQLTSMADKKNTGALGVINYIRTRGLDKSALKEAGKDVNEYFINLEYELEKARL